MAASKRSIASGTKLEHGRRAARMASYILIAKVLSFLAMGIAFLVVVRLLGPNLYGVYTVALAASGFFGTFGSLGISSALMKFIPEYMERKEKKKVGRTIADGMWIMLLMGTAFAAITFLLSGYLAAGMHNPSYGPVIQVASLVVVLSVLYGAITSVLIGLGRERQFAAVTIIQVVSQAALAILLALSGWGAYAPLVALILGYVIGLALSLAFVYLRDAVTAMRPSGSGMRELLKFSWPIGLSGILGSSINNIIPIVLGVFATAFVLGNFGVVSKISSLMDIVTGSIGMALLPSFAGSFARGESTKRVGKYYAYSVHFSFVLMAPVIIAVIMLAQPVSVTAFSALYTLAPAYVQIFALGLLVSIFGIYTTQLLIGAGKVKQLIKYTAAMTAIQLALIPMLIPTLGGYGAVLLLYLITPLLTDTLFIYAIKRDFGAGIWVGKLARASAANAMMAVLLLPVMWFLGSSYVSIIAAAVLIFAAYPPLIAVTGGLTAKDLDIMRNVMRGVPALGQLMGVLSSYAGLFSR